MKQSPVVFSQQQQQQLFASLAAAADEFHFHLSDASVESWHLHWIVFHDDRASTMIGRLKNRMRQALSQGRIWTDGFPFHELENEEALQAARQSIAKRRGIRLIDDRPVAPSSAGA